MSLGHCCYDMNYLVLQVKCEKVLLFFQPCSAVPHCLPPQGETRGRGTRCGWLEGLGKGSYICRPPTVVISPVVCSSTDVSAFVHTTCTLMIINNCIAKMEVGCLRHKRASTIGSQIVDEDCSHGWQILATQP